jgi:hypothetical protein
VGRRRNRHVPVKYVAHECKKCGIAFVLATEGGGELEHACTEVHDLLDQKLHSNYTTTAKHPAYSVYVGLHVLDFSGSCGLN